MDRAGDSAREHLRSARIGERSASLRSNFLEGNSQIIIEFDKHANPEIIKSIQDKLENEKFTVLRHGQRMYLVGDELSMLFEAQLNGLVKFNKRERCWKSFQLEDYLDLSADAHSDGLTSTDSLSKILSRSEKARIAQHMIEENIQVSKPVHIPSLGNCYPGQSFILVCLKNKIIRQIYLLPDEELRKALASRWSNYLISLCLVRLPVNELRAYLNENIAIYFHFADKLIKMLSLPMLSYTVLVCICNLDTDHPIIPLTCSLMVHLSFLIFVKAYQFSRSELTSEWRLDGELVERHGNQPRLDYKCRTGLYHSGLLIRALLPRPEETRRQFKTQRSTWSILVLLFACLLAGQICFFHLNEPSQHIAFNSMVAYYVPFNLIRHASAKFIVYRTDLEEHFTLKSYQIDLFTKMLLLNSLVHNSLPLLCILFAGNSTLVDDVLSGQLLISLTVEVAYNLLWPISSYFCRRFVQIIRSNEFLENEFVLTESSKDKFGSLLDEWLFLFQQSVYVLLFCSAYPKIVTIVYLNVLIRNFINFLKISLLCKRPLFEAEFYSKAIEQCLSPLFVLTSVVNLLNLDLYFYSDLITSLNLTTQQWNLIIVVSVVVLALIVWLLPGQSVKTKNRQELVRLEKFATLRMLDESALSQTVHRVRAFYR